MALVDAQLDKWLAENLLGWSNLVWHDRPHSSEDNPDGPRYRGWFGTDPTGRAGVHFKGYPSSDPIYSQQVVRAMAERGYGISKVRRPSDHAWSVTFFDTLGQGRPTATAVDSNESRACGEAAKIAILATRGEDAGEAVVGTVRGTDW